MKKIIIILIIIITIPMGLWCIDVLNDGKAKVEILEETIVWDNWNYHAPGYRLFTLIPGENVNVLRIRYGKDFMAEKIANSKGNEGWIYFHSKKTLIYWPNEI